MKAKAFLLFFACTIAAPAALLSQEVGGPPAGAPAPPLTGKLLSDAPGDAPFDLASCRGKAVVLEFWATWCAPCIAQFDHLNRLADRYRDQPIELVAVSIDRGADAEDKIRRLLAERPLRTRVVLAASGVEAAYGIVGVPLTVLVDREGRIDASTTPGKLTEAMLDRLARGHASGAAAPATDPARAAPSADDAPLLTMSIQRSTGSAQGGFSSEIGFGCQGVSTELLAGLLHDVPIRRVVVAGVLPEDRWQVEVRFGPGQRARLIDQVRATVAAAAGFTARREEREIDVYAMSCPAGVRTAQHGEVQLSTHSGEGHWSKSDGVIAGVRAPYARFVQQIERELDRPLVDRSGLSGEYDYRFTYTEGDRASLLRALGDAGLVLRPERARVEVLVVQPAS